MRISGPNAIPIAQSLFKPASGKLADGARRISYGHVITNDGVTLDEALLHIMKAPHSYTREDVVEINCHAGAGPVNAVLQQVLLAGARLAGPGEFTQRAFLNGRIDLVQAEAVIDTIRAQTEAGLRAASSASRGQLSREINRLKETLTNALARIEAAVDFPDEDLPDLVGEALFQALTEAGERIAGLLATAEAGRLYREGAAMAIAGHPNVGKSSVFNALLRDSRAIVSAVPGTTRDRIEELVTLAGVPVRLTDTAGLRNTDDAVEKIGVQIARQALQTADIVLYVLDASKPVGKEDEALAAELAELQRPVWIAWNKTDLAPGKPVPDFAAKFAGATAISAKTGEGIQQLEQGLGLLLLGGAALVPDQGLVTRAHQRDSLRRAQAAVGRVLQNRNASPEFLSIDLRDALDALGEITGETTSEDILHTIFSSFCIGK